MAIGKVILDGSTLIDATPATASASDITAPKTAMLSNGVMTTGTATTHAIGVNDTTDAAGGTIREFVGVDLGSDTVTAEHLELGYTAHDATGTAITGTMPAPTGDVSRKDVNFYDYDGALVASKTKAEINAMTSDSDLPTNPTHTGLTAQGWNWTVAQLKAQLTAMPDQPVLVGQNYITTSGDTEIDIDFVDDARLSPYLRCGISGTIVIDWGDNTTPSTVTGSSLNSQYDTQHVYASKGKYTIVIHVEQGSFSFYGGSTYPLLHGNKNSLAGDTGYGNCVHNIRIGSNVSISGSAFQFCYSLASVTIPSSITSIGNYAFYNCKSLASITIPSGVTRIGGNAFYGCNSLTSVTIPSSVTNIAEYAFGSCYSLTSITIPSGLTTVGTNVFNSCYTLSSIAFSSNLTTLNSSSFEYCYSLRSALISSTNITILYGSIFNSCNSLASMVVPSSVTTIKEYAFRECRYIAEYHFKSTTPPTLANTNAFNNIASDCIIYVPYSADHSVLEAYKTAQNWSDYASYMQEEPAS